MGFQGEHISGLFEEIETAGAYLESAEDKEARAVGEGIARQFASIHLTRQGIPNDRGWIKYSLRLPDFWVSRKVLGKGIDGITCVLEFVDDNTKYQLVADQRDGKWTMVCLRTRGVAEIDGGSNDEVITPEEFMEASGNAITNRVNRAQSTTS